MSVHPSGEQFEIRSGSHRATIVEVGGGVREYEVDGRPVLEAFPVENMCDGAHGMPLIPWPNRLADGKYEFDGEKFQVSLTEPEKNNAIHGFLMWRSWRAIEHEADRVIMATRLHPLGGYPFTLEIQAAYVVSDRGLKVTTTATNIGDRVLPYGHGQHPYLSPGSGLIDECTLQLAGRTRIDTDAERQLPSGTEPVDGTSFDFIEARRLGKLEIDFAFKDLERDDDGYAWTRLTGPDSNTASLWVDGTYSMIQTYTGDTLSSERARRGLGTEPMTLAPDGFNSGDGLIRIEPGQSVTTTWGALLA